MSFFSHTLKAAGQENSSLNLFLLKNLREEGIALQLCDVWCNESGIYLLLNDNTLMRVFVHQAVLSDRDFQAQGAPYFHFAPCQRIVEVLQSSEHKGHYFASVAFTNAFTFKIAGRRAALSVHHDAPLDPCPYCLEHAHMTQGQIQSNFESLSSSLYSPRQDITESEYESLINFFKNTFKNTCSYCHEQVDKETLFLVQNEQAAFLLICNRHQG